MILDLKIHYHFSYFDSKMKTNELIYLIFNLKFNLYLYINLSFFENFDKICFFFHLNHRDCLF